MQTFFIRKGGLKPSSASLKNKILGRKTKMVGIFKVTDNVTM